MPVAVSFNLGKRGDISLAVLWSYDYFFTSYSQFKKCIFSFSLSVVSASRDSNSKQGPPSLRWTCDDVQAQYVNLQRPHEDVRGVGPLEVGWNVKLVHRHF